MSLRFDVVPTSHPDARRMLAAYYAEIRKRFGFDVSRQAAPEDMDPPGGRFVVAYEGRRRLPAAASGPGSRVCARSSECSWRPTRARHGHGRAVLEALERTAREAGFRRIVLDTMGSLTEAMTLYDGSGYARVPAYNENPYASAWFAKDL